MSLVQNDDMIEQVTAAVADEAFCDSVLPRAAKARSLGFDAEALDGASDIVVEIRGAIEDQVFRGRAIGKCLSQLLCHRGACGMPGDIPVKDAPAVVGDDEEAMDHPEGQCGHGEEVHRGDCFAMIAQESCPPSSRLRISGAFRIHRSTVRSEISNPSILNSP